MVRLPLLFGLFLSFTVSGIVFLLSMIAKVAYSTMIYRTLSVFFVFGFLGVVLGSVIEILVAPTATQKEKERLDVEVKLEDEFIEQELGDLLNNNKGIMGSAKENKTVGELKPAVFPRMTVEGGKVVSRGDSAVVS